MASRRGSGRIGRGQASRDGWWRLGYWTVGLLLRICFRLRCYGLRNLPVDGAALIACNHVSVLDPIALGVIATWKGRTVRFLAAAEVFDTPVIGWGLRAIRQIPIQRGARDWAAMEEAGAVIRDGALAGIFPEGRVGEEEREGSPQPLQKGAARLALTAGVPLVPMAIWGTQVRWPRGGITARRPLRPRIAVVVGEPIAAAGDARDPVAVRALTERLTGAMERLLVEARRRGSDVA